MPDPLDLDPDIRDALLQASTAPISSQLVKRGLRNVFIARSARITPSRAHKSILGVGLPEMRKGIAAFLDKQDAKWS